MTALKAIRAKCLECCNGQRNEVRLCPITDCALYPFRFGHKPQKASVFPGVSEENTSQRVITLSAENSENNAIPLYEKDRQSAGTLKRSSNRTESLEGNDSSRPFYHTEGGV